MDDGVQDAVAALDAALNTLLTLPHSALTDAELLTICAGLQDARNRIPAVEHRAIAALGAQTTPAAIGAKSWPLVLATRLGISVKEARRRCADAAELGPRVSMTGEALAPKREHIAAAQADGALTPDHVTELFKFFTKCPDWVTYAEQCRLEEKLVTGAIGADPETVRQAVDHAVFLLDQDGPAPTDNPPTKPFGITFGPQQPDGSYHLRGKVSAEFKATFDPIDEKLAAPGMCNPADEAPCVSGTPSQQQIDHDERGAPERRHDAMLTAMRLLLAHKDLGQINGLPATLLITTTLQELEKAAGVAITAGGTKLSIPDLIRLATQAHHYLAVYDEHTGVPLYLGRARRTASAGQRLAIWARDRGCTRPGCTANGYRCQAHHATTDYSKGGLTDADALALACGCDNRLVGEAPNKWTTRINNHGQCEWIPPQLLDRGQHRTNTYHHPETLLADIKSGFTDDTADSRSQTSKTTGSETHAKQAADTEPDTAIARGNDLSEKPAIPPELLDQDHQQPNTNHHPDTERGDARNSGATGHNRDHSRKNGDRDSGENRGGHDSDDGESDCQSA
ncbi:HNH endonuclease [Mycolicibacterium smegmatis]|uniref:HNH endonuclease signature motif containing protein n=2 Tax=Mycolicibacterium smegmatis TaxID=1772 RepID=UPI001EFB8086|nr:HNH endonuclease signature motif containing protein [Mycolicibacterium smegmatis]ULN31165.1 HNH endonuclease [Mycolicibacterium smegmatis]